MKIIVITPILPYPLDKNGFTLSLGSLIDVWVKDSHEVHVFCFGDSNSLAYDYYIGIGVFVYCENIKSSNVRLLYTDEYKKHPKPRNTIQYDYSICDFKIDGDFDLAILSGFESVFLLEKVKERINVKDTVFFEVDALSLLYNRLARNTKSLIQYVYYKFQAKLIRNVEKSYYPRFDKICFVSSDDREYSISQFPEIIVSKFINIRNGVDFSNLPLKLTELNSEFVELGFSGDFSYKPNQAAADFIINKILPVLSESKFNIRFTFIGRNPTYNMVEASKKFEETLRLTGEVENIFMALNCLDLYICPLFVGAGIKNKILNVMGLGIPFIATQISIEGIDELNSNTNSWIIDSTDSKCWAEVIDRFLSDYDENLKLSKEYKKLISKNYKWTNIAREFIHKSIEKRCGDE